MNYQDRMRQDRMRKELEQLKDRCNKLEIFLDTDTYEALSDGDQMLLLSQCIHMTGYCMILGERVNRLDN